MTKEEQIDEIEKLVDFYRLSEGITRAAARSKASIKPPPADWKQQLERLYDEAAERLKLLKKAELYVDSKKEALKK